MKDKLAKAISYFNKFVQSDWFILFTALMVFVGWVSKAWVPLLCVLVAISIIPLFLAKETKHLLAPIMMFTFIISTDRHHLTEFAPLIALVGVLLIGVVFNLVRFRRGRQHWEFLHPTKIKGFHCALIALIIPFAFGGVGSPYEHPLAVLATVALIIIFALVYTFFTATNRDSEQKSKLGEYMLKILFVTGILLSLQLVIYFARLGGMDEIKQAIIDRNIFLGWGTKNNVAQIISMCIPAGFYFSIKKSKLSPLFVIVALLEYALLFTTSARGAILVATIAMPAMLLYTIVKSENKLAFGITVCAAFAVAIVLVAYFGETVTEIIGSFLNKGLDSSGRIEDIYPVAADVFKRWPIFGAGWDYRLGDHGPDMYSPYWYHSTVLQIIATMGVVGVIAFVFFYFWRYRTFLAHRKNPTYIALLAGLLLFDLYGMVDTTFFSPTFFAMLLCMTFVAEINLPDDRYLAFGGRNPFSDIKNGCKQVVSKIKAKISAKKAVAGVNAVENPADSESISAVSVEDNATPPTESANSDDGDNDLVDNDIQ
ncbi:MAG: O-antigen ligase family protein [Bacteroides sp.]|nr:O-antigen ligase family protein [Bacillota bacterium]MCM1393380.1 O-antigen ligase family protein [[Eubacterium] siraeum]MCM1455528.1 O-antigen ligase family protein [Bacteroides sp.]